jgi:hypothetical protein
VFEFCILESTTYISGRNLDNALFNFLPNMPELSENELDDIRERQENAGLFGMRLPISTDSGFTMKDCVIHKDWQWFVYTDLTSKLTPMISIVLPTPPA